VKDHESGQGFAGPVPDAYEQYMVPMFFQPYADDLVARLAALDPRSVLEVAAGTGVVTRGLAARLSDRVSITASDLSPAMIDRAVSIGTSRPVQWEQADVVRLPFDDGSFDAVACQFGVMFFPDRPAAFSEMARVLRPGGTAIFTVWDALAANEFAEVVDTAVAGLFPDDPPGFVARTPHGYFDEATIQADLAAGGFATPARFDVVDARSTAPTAAVPAFALCHGTPLRNEIEARDPSRLAEATAAATAAIERRFGATDIEGRMRAFVVTATTP
jgi:SAM-dependent methyltransferase